MSCMFQLLGAIAIFAGGYFCAIPLAVYAGEWSDIFGATSIIFQNQLRGSLTEATTKLFPVTRPTH